MFPRLFQATIINREGKMEVNSIFVVYSFQLFHTFLCSADMDKKNERRKKYGKSLQCQSTRDEFLMYLL